MVAVLDLLGSSSSGGVGAGRGRGTPASNVGLCGGRGAPMAWEGGLLAEGLGGGWSHRGGYRRCPPPAIDGGRGGTVMNTVGGRLWSRSSPLFHRGAVAKLSHIGSRLCTLDLNLDINQLIG